MNALDRLSQQPPVDVLLCDIALDGGMSGFDVARAARRLNPSLRLIYFSGYAENLSIESTAPMAKLLQKPCSFSEITRAIRNALSD